MKLVITEKNIAADKIAKLLCDVGKPEAASVYKTPCYKFKHQGEEWVTIGLRGHILKLAFPEVLHYNKKTGWAASLADDERSYSADLPATLELPPFKKKGAFLTDGVKLKSWNLDALPYLVWSPIVKQAAEKEIIRALKNLAKKADEIIIATDFDREGELIGSDALEMVREVNQSAPVFRARYSAITKAEIDHAFSTLVELDNNLAAAGESRRNIDLIWGAVLTRYLSLARRSAFGDVRSAGRVQTPTLALVCKREDEREAFIPEDYWQIKAELSTLDGVYHFKAMHESSRFKDRLLAEETYQRVAQADKAQLSSRESKLRNQQVPVPFNTTSLMAAASAEGISPGRCMRIAESLYMDGLISYPRVDNTVYPASLDLKALVKELSKVPQYSAYCSDIMSRPLKASRGKQETTDHPPIHPVSAVKNSESLKPEEWKLYNLIARRFLATLGEPARIKGTKFNLDIAGERFVAQGDVLDYPGFRAIYPYGLKKDEQLPDLQEGDVVTIETLNFEQKQTEPPARYSQGKLIQEMEHAGLGTKSTRHSIIERLYEVKYLKGDPIEPSQLGRAIIAALEKFAPHVTTANMTAELENEMDNIAGGSLSDREVLAHSRSMLADIMSVLLEHTEDLSEGIAEAVAADAKIGVCPSCGKDLQVKTSMKTKSRFIGCSAWPECEVTYPLPSDPIERVDEVCEHCGAPQVKVKPFRRKAYITCVNPKCPTNYMEPIKVANCSVCAEKGIEADLLAVKSERTGKRFIRCTNHEECSVSYPLPPTGDIRATGRLCEHCGAPIVDIVREKGVWTICVNMDCPAKQEQANSETRQRKKPAARKKTSRVKKS